MEDNHKSAIFLVSGEFLCLETGAAEAIFRSDGAKFFICAAYCNYVIYICVECSDTFVLLN